MNELKTSVMIRKVIFLFLMLLFTSCKTGKPIPNEHFQIGYYKANTEKSIFRDSLQIYFRKDGTLSASQYRKIQHVDGWWGWRNGTWQKHSDTLVTKVQAYYFSNNIDTIDFRKYYGHEDTAFMITNSYLVRGNKLLQIRGEGLGRSIGRTKGRSIDFYLADSTKLLPGSTVE